MSDRYGRTWVYESIVGAIPGLSLPDRLAVAVQFVLFEALVLAAAAAYGYWNAVVPGTVAVAVAAAGSAFMLDMGRRVRTLSLPDDYTRLLFGSSVEVVLGVLAYVALVTYLFVVDPRDGATLLEQLFGPSPAAPAVALALLVLWDVCYRIGTGWWAAVLAAYRELRYSFDGETAAELRALDSRNVGFALLQLVLVPLLGDQPVLALAVAGHVLAVGSVVAVARFSSS
ncbi:DUF7530 family protein [Salarchaeum japonicum]|uniref:Uncharacterized protein n=1 Tax=Salarchaeum japonicum TaxID=555573 RepID=A0AAV3T0Z6_9EURY|nr:hypothetical protein [Salarchaeum japonicum]